MPALASRLRSAWPALALLACAGAVHAPLLLGGVPYWRDAHLSNVPAHVRFSQWLHEGILPEWWPYDGGGSPLLTVPTTEVFHPTVLLYALLPPLPALVLHGLVGTLLALGGTWLLARELGQSRPAALLAAALYGAGGYLVGLVEWTFMLVAAGTLPFTVWSLLVAHRRRGRTLLLPSGVLALQLLAGDPQAAVLATLAGAVLLVVVRGLDRTAVALVVGSTALAVLLAAVMLVPVVLGQPFTERGGAMATASRWPLELRHLAGMVFPFRHGPFDFVDSTAFGLPGLGLAGAALVQVRRERAVAGLVVLAVTGLWLALGDGAGLTWVARRVVPFWASFRYPIKSLELALFALALLAGAGLDVLASARRPAGLVAAGLAVAVSLGVVAAAGQWPPPWVALPGLGMTAVALAAGARGGRVLHLAAATLAAQVALVAMPLVPSTDPSFYQPPPLALELAARGVGIDGPAFDRVFGAPVAPEAEAWVGRAAAGGGMSQLCGLWGLPTVSVYGIGGSGRLRSLFTSEPVEPAQARRVLGILGVGYLVGPVAALGTGAEVLARDPDFELALVRSPRSLPRAYAVHRARGVPGPVEARRQLLSGLLPGREVVLEGEVPAEQALRPDQPAVPAVVTHPTHTSVTVKATLPWDGWVVLNEAWFPGWRAWVDGQEVPVRIANLAMRAVEVPRGTHHHELS
jgi:hypothetical protein